LDEHTAAGLAPHGAQASIHALSAWLQTPPGQYLLAWEQAFMDQQVADVFGYHALQIGPIELDALRCNRMPHRWRGSLAGGDGVGEVTLEAEDLPFPAQSLDFVVLAHVLEFSHDPHQVIREVERVLIPEGRVLVVGLNPYSLWGIRQRMLRGFRKPYLPEEGEFLSLPRLKDWMKLLSLEVERGRYGCYVPPVRQEKWLERWRWMDSAGDRYWPVAGNVYAVSAIKRVRGMRLVGLARKPAHAPRAAPVPATHRNRQKELELHEG
jgi:SAM-dependent methyltransferase